MSQKFFGTVFYIKLSILFLVLPLSSLSQTRTEELEGQRREYQKGLAPEKTTGAEEVLRRFKDDKILERVNYGYNGLSVRLGGLVTGGGFALGPQHFRDDLKDGALMVGAAAELTINSFSN